MQYGTAILEAEQPLPVGMTESHDGGAGLSTPRRPRWRR
jgi:hypothetical protein